MAEDKSAVMNIKDLVPNIRYTCVLCIVLETGHKVTSKDSEIRMFRVADKTASIDLAVWGDAAKVLQPSDIIRVDGAYTSLWNGRRLTVCARRPGVISKIGEFTMVFAEMPDMSLEEFANQPPMQRERPPNKDRDNKNTNRT